MRRLPPPNSLIVFDAVARYGSISAAAEELGRTHGAVSQQIRKLQDNLGFAVIERYGTGIRLTDMGQELKDVVVRSLDGLEGGIGALRGRSSSNTVRLGIGSTLALKWLMPRLADFHHRHPDVNVQLSLGGQGKLELAEHDLILSYDRLTWDHQSKEEFEVIGDVSFGIVLAPTTPFERTDTGARIGTALVRSGNRDAWYAWQRQAGMTLRVDEMRILPQTAIILEAAAAGQGVAVVERRLAEDDLERGRLTAPLGFVTIPNGFAALVSQAASRKRSVRWIIDWLREVCRAE
jgi:DNA-binding transcriptional LysR family regulator